MLFYGQFGEWKTKTKTVPLNTFVVDPINEGQGVFSLKNVFNL